MCCLGFAELADGASIEEITAVGEPCFVERKHGPEMMNLILETPNREDYPTKYASTSVAGQLMKANDSLDYRTGIERENEIIRLGKTVGIEFQFVD
jgi:hypothetical protein